MSEGTFKPAVPILFVRDVADSAAFFADKLGFAIDFLHGEPPFYGSVSRGEACLHLRFVREPNFSALAATDLAGLFEEYRRQGVDFAQPIVRQPWGGTDFQVRDPDGNVFSFVEYA